jgi:ABC-type multidrug transport system permease subunit
MAEAQGELITETRTGARQSGARSTRLHPLIELTRARVRESVRQPEAIFWSFVFPALLAIALGIAFRNAGPEKNRVAVISSVASAAETAAALSRSADLEAVVMTPDEAALALRTGKVALIVQSGIPAAGASVSSFDYRFDPTRPESRIARLAVDDALQRAAGRSDAASVREITVTETGARYIDFLIPGLIGLNLLSSGMWSIGFTIVYTRTQKLLKRLAATPMRRWHYLLSFILSRLIFLALEIIGILGFAWLIFGVKMHGSLISFILIAIIGSMSFCGLGLLIAARTKTVEGASGWMNVVMMPMWLLSGSFFSAARFPDFAQPFIRLLPLTALNDALRAVMNEGATLAANTGRIAVMLAWGLISFVIALRIFRWQ